MKTKILAMLVLTFMSLNTTVYSAEEVILPTISKPAVLQEGTQRVLTAAQIAELLPWAKNSKATLVDLLDSIQNLSTNDKIERLILGIEQVVQESAPKNTELLMRYVLNRALLIQTILSEETNENTVGVSDAKLRNLISSINMSINYYESDMRVLTKKGPTNFEQFGAQYFLFLNELNKSIFDASAQYKIQKTALEWLQWDLYRDLNSARHAPKIVKINNALKLLPEKKISDAQAIKNIQLLKKVAQQVNIQENLGTDASIKEEKREVQVVINRSEPKSERSSYPARTKFYYDTFKRSCYPLSASGDTMSTAVSDELCAQSGQFYYDTLKKSCYKVSTDGDAMPSSSVSDNFCAAPNKYYYDTLKRSCYKESLDGGAMYSSNVSDSLCANPGVYYYDSLKKGCYKESLAGDVMYSSNVSEALCI